MNEQMFPVYDDGINKELKKQLRLGFIRKVLGIVTAQIFLNGLICYLIYQSPDTSSYFRDNYWPLIVALILYIITGIAIVCCKELAQSVPTNYILLLILTSSVSVMVGYSISYYDPEVVLRAFIITVIISLSLTLYALLAKIKMTYLIGGIIIVALSALTTGIIALITRSYDWYTLYYFFGVILYGLFLIFDVKRISSTKYGISHEDYIYGAMMIYLDIVLIFLEILRLSGRKD